ncbi:MAG: hypothetical protein KAH11_05725 [Rhodospirillales bacterium]|nr:hypothetical protein [Rhodospirillales bacterium]
MKEKKVIEPNLKNVGKADETATKEMMIKYGITNEPVDCFHVDGFKYSRLSDAVAQAKRAGLPKT